MDDYKKIKKKLIKKFKNTCFYCNLQYDKYLYVHKNNLACKICYMINNRSINSVKQFDIYYSLKTQSEIIKNSIKYIKENGEIPLPNNIDNNVLKINLSIVEYFDILKKKNNLPSLFNNIKYFFNYDFDYSFIDNNHFSFVDNTSYENNYKKEIEKMNSYKFNNEELEFLNNFFSS